MRGVFNDNRVVRGVAGHEVARYNLLPILLHVGKTKDLVVPHPHIRGLKGLGAEEVAPMLDVRANTILEAHATQTLAYPVGIRFPKILGTSHWLRSKTPSVARQDMLKGGAVAKLAIRPH